MTDNETREPSSEAQELPSHVPPNGVVVNPATSLLLAELSGIRLLLQEIRSNAERQEVPAPGSFPFYPQPLVASHKIRVVNIIVCPVVATSFGVRVGTRHVYKVRGADGAILIPAEITIERGTMVELWSLATGARVPGDDTVALDAFLLGYTE